MIKQRVGFILFCILIGIIVFNIKITASTLPHTNGAIIEYDVQEAEIERVYSDVWLITAYCGCEKCCGIYASPQYRPNGQVLTANGGVARSGYTVASSLPFGTIIEIEGYGTVEVMDRGVSGNHLDLYFDTHEQACSWGSQYKNVYIHSD